MRGLSTADADQALARIAGRSHGVVTRAGLLRAGLTYRQVEERIKRGALLRQYRGVYRVGHQAPSTEARYMAAVLACGDGALLAGHAAAYLLEILKGKPPPPEVTVPTKRIVNGIKTTRSRPGDATVWRGIPITTVPRTLVDLAPHLTQDDLARACHEAGIRHHTTPAQVEAVLARRPRCPGAPRLRAVLHGDVPVTLSKLEAEALKLLRDDGLDRPDTNCVAGGRRVDLRWPKHKLTVELDSYRYHRSRHAWEQDRHREREARARGDEFRRYTYGDVFEHPAAMLAELRTLIGRARAPAEMPPPG